MELYKWNWKKYQVLLDKQKYQFTKLFFYYVSYSDALFELMKRNILNHTTSHFKYLNINEVFKGFLSSIFIHKNVNIKEIYAKDAKVAEKFNMSNYFA